MLALGKESAVYDPAHPPYAVFDWDNTSVFLDVEEATLAYQLDNLAFGSSPLVFADALAQSLPDDPRARALHADIAELYARLYQQLESGAVVSQLRGSPSHSSFRAKFFALYHLLESAFGASLAYAWLPYRFTGMTAPQVRQLTRAAVLWQLGQPIEVVEWRSDESQPGRSGPARAVWRSGLRLLPEMQSLYGALRQAGFDVWVCTASFVEGIREISSDPLFGYANPPERVIGLELASDASGRFLPRNREDITYASGKTRAIRRRLIRRYGYEPALVAGDSDGDAAMLVDFPATRVSLIMDTGRPADSPIGRLAARARAERGQPGGSRFLLQERDEMTGRLLP